MPCDPAHSTTGSPSVVTYAVPGPIEVLWELFGEHHLRAKERLAAMGNPKVRHSMDNHAPVWTFQGQAYNEAGGPWNNGAYAEYSLTEDGNPSSPTITLRVMMATRGPNETEVRWTASGTLFGGRLDGFSSGTYQSLRGFAEQRFPPRFTFEANVFPAELDTIRRRFLREPRSDGDRAVAALQQSQRGREPAAVIHGDPAERPTTAHGLVGLALSGGGIRSSTFNLGILQGLHRVGILRHVDYLSTVSGGGYIGSAWTAYTQHGAAFPFARAEDAPAEPDTPAVTHLRDHGNYLMPGGWLDSIRMVLAVVRGVFLNFFLLIPYLLLLAVLTTLVAGRAIHDDTGSLDGFWLTKRLIIAVVFWLIASAPITMWVGWVERHWAAIASIATARGNELGKQAYDEMRERLRVHPVTNWLIERYVAARAEGSATGRLDWFYLEVSRPLATRISLFAYRLRDRYEKSFAVGALLVLLAAFVEVQPLVLSKLHHALSDGQNRQAWAGVGSVASVAAAGLSRIPSRVGGRIALFVAALLGPALPISLYLLLADWLIFDGGAASPLVPGLDPTKIALLTATATAVALLVYAQLFINVNQHSGHGFWRDRLSRAFLSAPREWGYYVEGFAPVHTDAVSFEEIAESNRSGTSESPYHLLNTTLNLQADQRLANRARRGEFFLFSAHFVGGPRTGFIPTRLMERIDPHVNLGTAMAISSAAAAPNMGSYTLWSVRFLMTLFNVRMGYWLPHPGRVTENLGLDPSTPWPVELPEERAHIAALLRSRGFAVAVGWSATPAYLFREMFGQMNDNHPLVNVSDGGHIENLGVYELLRRRCKIIIVGDGEADGQMQFGSLAALIRFARLDLGVEIEIALDALHATDGKPGRDHCVIGTIIYPPRGDTARVGELARAGASGETLPEPEVERGTLVYFKSSITGDEGSMIAQYRAVNPDFPHESTADQKFSEEQFEAYRWLGFHAATSCFGPTVGPIRAPSKALPLSYREFEAWTAAVRETR